MNTLFNFKLVDGTTVSQSFNIVPINFPTVSSSFLVNGDILTSSKAPATVDLLSNVFKVELNKNDSNNWYFSGSHSTASAALISGSYSTGNLCAVTFKNLNNGRNYDAGKTISIKPVNKNVGFNDSFILQDKVEYTTDATGSLVVPLVPQVYTVIYYGGERNETYTVLIPNSASVNANLCIVTTNNVAKNITPKNQSEFAYTAQVSDARYLSNLIPISSSLSSSWASSSFQSVSSSFAQTAKTAVNSTNASTASTSLTASFASTTLTASYATNVTTASDGFIVATGVLTADAVATTYIETIPGEDLFLGSDLWLDGPVIRDGNGGLVVDANNHRFVGTASFASTASFVTASNVRGTVTNALTASYVTASKVVIGSSTLVPFGIGNSGLGITANGATVNLNLSATIGAANDVNANGGQVTIIAGTGTTGGDVNIGAGAGSVTNGTINLHGVVNASNGIIGDVTGNADTATNSINADTASFANTASYLDGTATTALTASSINFTPITALTASFVTASNVRGTVTNSLTASYVTASNVVGVVSNSISSSYFSGSQVTASAVNTRLITNNSASLQFTGSNIRLVATPTMADNFIWGYENPLTSSQNFYVTAKAFHPDSTRWGFSPCTSTGVTDFSWGFEFTSDGYTVLQGQGNLGGIQIDPSGDFHIFGNSINLNSDVTVGGNLATNNTIQMYDSFNDDNITITSDVGAITIGANLHVTGKITGDGGIDPPYVLYDRNTREALKARVLNEVTSSKQGGAALFFNQDTNRLETYVAATDKYYDMMGTEII